MSQVTEVSFVDFMSKCGMVKFHIRTKKSKVKIYRDEECSPKGDGRVLVDDQVELQPLAEDCTYWERVLSKQVPPCL